MLIAAQCGILWRHLLSVIIFSLPTFGCMFIVTFSLLQGGFARVHELIDLTTNTVYAGKIIPKNRITKRHRMQKVRKQRMLGSSGGTPDVFDSVLINFQ